MEKQIVLIGLSQQSDKLVFVYQEGKCTDNCPEERKSLRFLVVIVTWFHSTGGLPRKACALARNDSVYLTNTNLLIC